MAVHFSVSVTSLVITDHGRSTMITDQGRSMRCTGMSVQFAVLASGSRGNSTLILRSKAPALLIDVGIGPKAIGGTARERRRNLVADRGRRFDAHPRRSRRHGSVRRNGAPRRRSLLPRRAPSGTGRQRGIPKARGGPADPALRSSSVLDLDRPAARADRAAPRRRPDFRVPDRGVGGTPATRRSASAISPTREAGPSAWPRA